MADKFPQSDLPRSVSGGSDVWDKPQASVILGGEFFAAPSDEFAGSAICVAAASAGLTVTTNGAALDVAGADAHPAANATTSNSVTVANNADRLMLVAVGLNGSAGVGVTSITYNGTGLTKIGETANGSDDQVFEIWGLKNPAIGTANIVVTANGFCAKVVEWAVLYNVDQTTSWSAISATGGGLTSYSATPTGVSGGYPLIFGYDGYNFGTPSISSGASQTRLATSDTASDGFGGTWAGAIDTETPVVGAQSLSFTFGGGSLYDVRVIGIVALPATAGGGNQALAGSLSVVASTTAGLSKTSTQAASALAVASAPTNLSKTAVLATSVASNTDTTGNLSKSAVLAGSYIGTTAATGDLSLISGLAASVAAVSDAAGIMSVQKPLAAAATVQASTTANLTAEPAGGLWTIEDAISEGANVDQWFDAQDVATITTTGANVTGWTDKTSNSNLANGSGANRPQYNATGLNGYPAIETTAAGQYLQPVADVVPAEWSHDVVTEGSADHMAVGGIGSTRGPALPASPFNGILAMVWPAGSISANSPAIHWRDGVLGTDYGDEGGGTAGTAGAYFAAIRIKGDPHGGASYGRIIDPSGYLFNRSAGDRTINAALGEFIYIQGTVGTVLRQKIEGYLAWKWGLQAQLPSGHPYESAPPSLAGETQALAGDLAATSTTTANLSRTASLAAGVAAVSFSAPAELSVAKPLAASATVVAAADGALSYIHSITGAGSVVAATSAALTKQSLQAGSAAALASASANLSRTATLTGALTGQAAAAIDLSKTAALAAGLSGVVSASADLTRGVVLAGDVAGVVSASGSLLVIGDFGGLLQAVSTTTGALSVAKPLAGDAACAAGAPVTLQINIPLIGDALSVVAATGHIIVAYAASANAVANTTASGDVSITKALAADAATVATGAGDMQILKRLASNAAALSTASAGLSITKALAGDALVVASAEGEANVDLGGGTANARCAAAGDLTCGKPLDGAAVSSAPDIVADLALTIAMAADIITQAAASAGVDLAKPLTGAALSVVAVEAPLDHTLTLAGAANAEANSLGHMLITKALGGDLSVSASVSAGPTYVMALASGLVVSSTASLFVPFINFADGVDAVVEVFAIHAGVSAQLASAGVDADLTGADVSGEEFGASILEDALAVEVDG